MTDRRGTCFLFSAIVLITLVTTGRSGAEDWTRFRGANGTGVNTQQGIPTSWSPGDFSWNVELPGVGHSSPVVWKKTLFVTSAVDEGAQRFLHCLDADSGKTRWSRMIGMNRSHKHVKNSWASSTPATDGQSVYASFGDDEHYSVAAWDFDGELLWRRNLGTFTSQHGLGVSPIAFEDMLIVANDQMGPSRILALDKATGRTRWSTLRTHRRTSYATPMIVQLKGEKPQLICVSGAMGVSSLDPYTGRMNWMTGEFPLRTVASPVFTGSLIIASCGGGGVGKQMIAVDPSEPQEAQKERIRWERNKALPYVPTPVVYGKNLYLWNDNGVTVCLESATGKEVWIKRLGETYSGSPVCINGKLYCINEPGDVAVIAASPEYKEFGTVSLGDPSHATPVVANGRLYLRTYHRLMCLQADE